MNNRRLSRSLAAAAIAIVAAAPAAAAHVTVAPGEAEKGGFATLSFRVPTERDDAATTSVEVNLPEDHPIRSVRVKPKPGWEYAVEVRTLDEPLVNSEAEETTEVVSKITWTGGEIGVDEFDEFEISVGPLPEDADQITFPTLQTYAGGEVVRWIDEPAEEGEEEPERPAPLLRLVDPEDEGESGGDGDDAAEGESAGGPSVEATASEDDVDSARSVGAVGIGIGVIGLVVGAVALVTGRKRAT